MPKAQNSPKASQNLSARSEFWAGVREEMPLIFGVAPFGLVFGVLGLESGLTPWQTILMSSILFGGASQIVFAQLWAAGVPALDCWRVGLRDQYAPCSL